MKKEVVFEENAQKEFDSLEIDVKEEFAGVLLKLQEIGELREPEAKKLNKDLFEVRIRVSENQWRGLYAYFLKNQIIILRIFQKKTQKTPKRELDLAIKRLKRL